MNLARRFRFPAGIAVALACLAPLASAGQGDLTPRAHAQTAQGTPGAAQGVLASVAYGELAPGLAIDVVALDDSDLGLALRQRFAEELGRAGHTSAGPPALSLTFETQVVPGRFSDDERSLGRIKGGSGGVNLQFNLWSSSQDSVLGGRKSTDRREANVLHMNVVLRDLGSRKVVWQADAYGELVSADHRSVGLAMVRHVVARIGQTATEERFALE